MASLSSTLKSRRSGHSSNPGSGSLTIEEQRTDRRLDLRIPAMVKRQIEERRIPAFTCNISPGGVLLEIDDCRLQAGESFELELTVPPSDGVSTYETRLFAKARVLRSNDHGQSQMVAARLLDPLRISSQN